MKRPREEKAGEDGAEEPPATSTAEVGENGKVTNQEPDVKNEGDGEGADNDDDEEDAFRTQIYSSRVPVRKGAECPYLDTISRQNLDFDFEKCCSVSLSPVNVYACLVCGKYFQGRSPKTHAYTHALEMRHHMFMKLDDGKVYCLPDLYEVVDRTLDDIRHVLNPKLTPQELSSINENKAARAVDGTYYMPGLVGLNNMKENDYANVIIQMLVRVPPIRDFFLVPENYKHCSSPLVRMFGDLLRKIWNPRAFRGQVSPHEFMQAVILASKKKFLIDRQSDPIEFCSWLLNTLHADLTGGKRKLPSVITKCFQGKLQVTTEAGTGKAKGMAEDIVEKVPFLLLGLDLPATPLFQDTMERNAIPQVHLNIIMQKFDGTTVDDNVKAGRRRYSVLKLPPYLVLHMKRFSKNNFFVEKNPTIVNFPVKYWEVKDSIPLASLKPGGTPPPSKYNLIANICHDGQAGEGFYRCHIHRAAEDLWYEVQDLTVVEVLPQMVALSEAYLQVYELQQQ
mmetsp:Transcript_1377/g.3976  ORF Transcript_1377/g.3976 Transcript_1377/m.3976 type:complete len:508 (+) Transcript_1377:229-1752(+)|eukprot:CAMPEP_0117651120 /NCGR_PEP_ID=MMETSP0804-20121206/1920_1 /TAXON_ID=1074897 /ORGANISM="Tetraselmis astigmatica, Strain CCMP880" /LENGTH=507 /DNA_ID=CAMNT_0005457071 /DNA_START=157 /DNA_END=1680 /DNA_ORIENTATION=-